MVYIYYVFTCIVPHLLQYLVCLSEAYGRTCVSAQERYHYVLLDTKTSTYGVGNYHGVTLVYG